MRRDIPCRVIPGVAEVGIAQVGTAEVGTVEVGMAEVGKVEDIAGSALVDSSWLEVQAVSALVDSS